MNCIFCRIARGEIPSRKVFENDHVLAFHDLHPQAPVHVLVIPKVHRASIADFDPGDHALAGELLIAVQRVAESTGIAERGYRVLSNIRDDGGQEVPHLHFHVVGGRKLGRMLPTT
jgi:histidine triad (HIT) family protein